MPSNENEIIFIHGSGEVQSNIFDWGDYRVGYYIAKNRVDGSNNEDALFIIPSKNDLVFGVSDGAGGHPRGGDAAFIVGENIIRSFSEKRVSEVDILKTIESINEEVLGLKAGAHCTLAVSTIEGDLLRNYCIGDSEIIYWNSMGSELYTSIPQSTVGYQIQAGMVNQGDSLDDPERYIVNNMVGDLSIRVEATSKMLIKKGHTMLLGSDGLFDNLSHEDLSEMVGKGVFEKSFATIVETCNNQPSDKWKKDDDISFVLVRKIKA